MPNSRNQIPLTILHSGQEHRLQTYWGEYRDLRALIADRFFLEDFGQCGGMGRCATCMIAVNGLSNEAALLKRNESTTLKKAGLTHANIRLSCQIPINDDLANVVVKVLEID